jgi:O-antigen/teichoic acid export membrane protein
MFVFLTENDSFGIGYIFLANLCASLVKPVLLYKDVLKFKFVWDKVLAKTMLWYSFPLVIAGFAGIINETFDRILIKRLLLDEGVEYAQTQVGIYSANYKLSILISLFIQAFRYAAEPFFFSREKDKNRNKIYAQIMTYFVIVVTLIFLIISLNLELFKWFIPNKAYWEGLKIVPILLLANVFLGIYYNQSIWYKLANKTRFGAYIALVGATITIALNLLLIPFYGYMGAAITTFLVYLTMMILSYFMGKKHYPIKYNLRKVGLYLFSAVAIYLISLLFSFESLFTSFVVNFVLLLLFIGIILTIERPLQQLKKR